MGTAKIDVSIGSLHILIEGDDAWVSSQLKEVMKEADHLGQLGKVAPSPVAPANNGGGSGGGAENAAGTRDYSTVTLAAFLKEKGEKASSKTGRFLATAAWLSLRGSNNLKTSEVSNALKTHHQSSVGNAAQCLINNCTSGLCEKSGSNFFVTVAGYKSLGIEK